jgi:hypothetical protein
MWAAIQFFSRSLRIAAYSSRAARYFWLRRARPVAASAAALPLGLKRPAVQVLLDEFINLRATPGWQRLDVLIDRFGAP